MNNIPVFEWKSTVSVNGSAAMDAFMASFRAWKYVSI